MIVRSRPQRERQRRRQRPQREPCPRQQKQALTRCTARTPMQLRMEAVKLEKVAPLSIDGRLRAQGWTPIHPRHPHARSLKPRARCTTRATLMIDVQQQRSLGRLRGSLRRVQRGTNTSATRERRRPVASNDWHDSLSRGRRQRCDAGRVEHCGARRPDIRLLPVAHARSAGQQRRQHMQQPLRSWPWTLASRCHPVPSRCRGARPAIAVRSPPIARSGFGRHFQQRVVLRLAAASV